VINDLLGRVGTINQAFVAIDDNTVWSRPYALQLRSALSRIRFLRQDTWKARNLTFDLGLRWEMRLSPRSPNDIVLRPEQRLAVGEPATNAFKFGEGKLYDDSLYQFAPTVGWPGTRQAMARPRFVPTIVSPTTGPTRSCSRRLSFQSAPGLTRAVTNNTFGQNGGLLRQGIRRSTRTT
jgi:hypothetical protein